MLLSKQCQKEIVKYINLRRFGIDEFPLFDENLICRGHYMDSKEGINRQIENRFSIIEDRYEYWEKLDMYFLEFIGHILCKHKITKQSVNSNRYISNTWKFKDINKLR